MPETWASGVIVCSPHSGRDFPDWFMAETQLDIVALRSSEDAFMDQLIQPALDAGAAMLIARLPRSIIDLNRSATELDPETIECMSCSTTPRVAAGLGVVPRVVSGARQIRDTRITMAEAKRRISTYWKPYHNALRGLINDAISRFGGAIIIDMHSMPHDAVSHMIPPLPEIVIGDRHGMSCSPVLRERVSAMFRHEGFRLRMNVPFSGAYIATAYGRPTQNVHVLQIEIDRALYLDSDRMEPSDNYPKLAEQLKRVLQQTAVLRPDRWRNRIAVAE